MEEVADKTYHIFYDNERDVERILNGSPRMFKNSWLIIQPWQREVDLEDIDYHHVLVWVHIIGLPANYRTKNMAMKIGASIGEVLDCGAFELPGKFIT